MYTKEQIVTALKKYIIVFACFLVDVKVYAGVAIRKAYDLWACFCYFVYTGYHRWCCMKGKVVFRPSLCDEKGRRFEIVHAGWSQITGISQWKNPANGETVALADATIALVFSMIFYNWNMKLIKIFLQRIHVYRNSPLHVYIRRDDDVSIHHAIWDFENEKNLVTHNDMLFGDVSIDDTSVVK